MEECELQEKKLKNLWLNCDTDQIHCEVQRCEEFVKKKIYCNINNTTLWYTHKVRNLVPKVKINFDNFCTLLNMYDYYFINV